MGYLLVDSLFTVEKDFLSNAGWPAAAIV